MLAGGTLGNAAAIYRWVKKAGVNAESSGLAGTLPTIFNNAILTLLAAVGIVHMLPVHELSFVQFYAFLLILILLSLGVLAVNWGKRHRTSFYAEAGKISAFFARILNRLYNPAPTENSLVGSLKHLTC